MSRKKRDKNTIVNGIIYIATSPSGKQYVGQTIGSFKKRKTNHKSTANRKLKNGKWASKQEIARAIRKYGFERFEWEVVFNGKIKFGKLNDLEKEWIKKLDTFHNGYNDTTGGDNAMHSDKTIEKLRKSSTGRKLSDEAKEKIRQQAIGRKASDETRRKLSIARKGKKLSNEHVEKMRISAQKQWENNPSRREQLSKRAKKQWENGHKETMVNALKEKFLDTEYAEKMKVLMAERWQDETMRKRMLDAMLKTNSSNETKVKRSLATKKMWSDPKFRSKMNSFFKSEENRERARKNGIERYQDPKERERTSRLSKENWRDPKFRKKMTDLQKTPEFRKKISDALMGEKNPSSKPVNQLTLDGEKFIKRHGSIREAERELGIHREQISRACKGKQEKAGGYKWEYAEK